MQSADSQALFDDVLNRIDRSPDAAGPATTVAATVGKQLVKHVAREFWDRLSESDSPGRDAVSGIVFHLPAFPLACFVSTPGLNTIQEYISRDHECKWARNLYDRATSDKVKKWRETSIERNTDGCATLPLDEQPFEVGFPNAGNPGETCLWHSFWCEIGCAAGQRGVTFVIAIGFTNNEQSRDRHAEMAKLIERLCVEISKDLRLLSRYDSSALALGYWLCAQETLLGCYMPNSVHTSQRVVMPAPTQPRGAAEAEEDLSEASGVSVLYALTLQPGVVRDRVFKSLQWLIERWEINGVSYWERSELAQGIDKLRFKPKPAEPEKLASFPYECHAHIVKDDVALLVRIVSSDLTKQPLGITVVLPLDDPKRVLDLYKSHTEKLSIVVDIDVAVLQSQGESVPCEVSDSWCSNRTGMFGWNGVKSGRYIRLGATTTKAR